MVLSVSGYRSGFVYVVVSKLINVLKVCDWYLETVVLNKVINV